MARYKRIKCELPTPLKINEINSIAHQVLCMHDRQTERTQKKRECYSEHSTTSDCLGLHSSTERRWQGCPDHTLCTHPQRGAGRAVLTTPSAMDAPRCSTWCFQAPSPPTEPTYTLSLANQELMKLCQQWGLSQDFPT